MKIEIFSEKLLLQGNTLKQYSANIDNYIEELTAITNEIHTAWAGDDASKYVNAFSDVFINENLVGLSKILKEHGEYLITTAKDQIKIEQDFGSSSS